MHTTHQDNSADAGIVIVPASRFSIQELTDIYNLARTDYIVPMPMSVARMQAYIHNYDLSLTLSGVAVDRESGQPLGISMLGVRPKHTWITRLGVLPTKRRRGAGRALMAHMIARSQELDGITHIILEVIKNNIPAHKMFHKFGFRELRELLILRRPPGPPQAKVPPYIYHFLESEDAFALLEQRQDTPAWLTETASLRNAGHIYAVQVELSDGSQGWMTYQRTKHQLGRLVLQTTAGDPRSVAQTLAHALHQHHPRLDTKTENIAADDPHVPGLHDMGYMEVFRRIEMRLDL